MAQSIDMFLSRLQGDDHQQARDPEGPRGEQLRALRQRLRRDFTALKDKAQKIRTDPSRSEVGKQQALTELGKQDLSVLAFLDSVRSDADTDLARYRTILFTTPKSERSETLAFLSEQEIRRKYEDQPPHVVQKAYLDAMARGDHERVRAFTQGPLGSLVDADFQRRVEQDHAQRTQPAVYENFEQAQILKDHVDSLRHHANQVLQTLADEAPVRAVA